MKLLGNNQAIDLIKVFMEIELGKHAKQSIHELKLDGFANPIYIRAIRADMQSFLNTFIENYLELKPYLAESGLVIDAGTNIGLTAVLFAKWWPKAKIVCIEPDQENYELALKNISNYPNITLIKGALWHKEADLKIEAGQEDGFVVREINESCNNLRSENVTKGVSIDHILRTYDMPHIDFLKMNIEGSEKEIFSENFQLWLPKTKAMLIELHDGKNAGCSKAVFQTVNQYDFAVAETAPYGVLFVKENIYRKWYTNWYREEIYKPNIDKVRFPQFYLDIETE